MTGEPFPRLVRPSSAPRKATVRRRSVAVELGPAAHEPARPGRGALTRPRQRLVERLADPDRRPALAAWPCQPHAEDARRRGFEELDGLERKRHEASVAAAAGLRIVRASEFAILLREERPLRSDAVHAAPFRRDLPARNGLRRACARAGDASHAG